ncbi:hypothetical protein FGE12_09650 [Aggregicoccus sp. 17bor-14]|uniref:hypothetical protein n=1 Tax=Myxococcaceae TaxID=31 RepID=UPI00129C35FA|nr:MULTISPECIES: hypothetical protein [Myxococcaceae]MBF5042664.1 hypothetical protein [Simulacricoccus sp. 17bor-14]MRI88432.1 hypothetical protein [Aggregicoccus sp. 17bor-14]
MELKFLPHRDVTFQSPLPPAWVRERISRKLAPPSVFRLFRPKEEFVGEVDGDTFWFARARRGRREFPVVRGRILDAPHGSTLEVRIRPPAYPTAFFLVVATLLAAIACMQLGVALDHLAPVELVSLVIPVGFAALLYALFFYDTPFQMDFAEAWLRHWVEAPPLQQPPSAPER